MPRKLCLIFVMVIVGLFILRLDFPAEGVPPKSKRFKHADKNKDGVVDKREKHMEKEWEQKQRSKVNTWWESRADVNKDGKLDSTELSAWKSLEKKRVDLNGDGVVSAKERRLCWRHARSKVNTSLEAEYDTNSDGWLQPQEAEQFLKDRYALIKTKGKAKVDSPLEEEYDSDGDGILDAEEANALKEDLQ